MRKAVIAMLSMMMIAGQLAVVGLGFGGAAVAAPICLPAGSSGMTAVVVATSGQHVSGTIDATGCDIGVYIGPGVTGVVVNEATITGANIHGIYAQDTSGVMISNNTVTNNAPGGEVFPETKAIQLTGTSFSTVSRNTVTDNGGGGIAVTDDGALTGGEGEATTAQAAISPGGPVPGTPSPGNYNQIVDNQTNDNLNGCGIVVSSYIPGEGVSHNYIAGNTVNNNPAGIVIAADTPNTTASYNTVVYNSTSGNGLANIIIHSNAPGDVANNNQIVFNTIDGGQAPGIGIIVGAEAPGAVLRNTGVVANHISNEQIGIATNGINRLWALANQFTNVEQISGPEPTGP